MKEEMVAFAAANADFLEGCNIVATGTTGRRIAEACKRLKVQRLKSDQQIGALIAEGEIDALISSSIP